MASTIGGDGVLLRPTTADDLDLAATIFRDPGCYEQWGGRPLTDAEISDKYLGDRSPEVECFFVVVDEQVAGFVQYWRADDGDGGGMDLVLRPAFRRRGVGRAVAQAVVRHVTGELGWRRFTVDPDVSNDGGVRFWRAVGFVPVRVVADEPGRQPYWLMEWMMAP